MNPISATNLNLDVFLVRNVLFVPSQPKLAMLSADNIGLLVIDTTSGTLIQILVFYEIFANFPTEFVISHMVPIGETGVRFILRDRNSMSLVWEKIGTPGQDPELFIGGKFIDQFFSIEDEIESGLISYNYLGFAQVMYYQKRNNLQNAYIRLYNFFNHLNSKAYKEVLIGPVESCAALAARFINQALLVVVCESTIYQYNVTVFPEINLYDAEPHKAGSLKLIANNKFSNQTIDIHVKNITVKSTLSGWILLVIFLMVVSSLSCFTFHVSKSMKKPEPERTESGKSDKSSGRRTRSKTKKSMAAKSPSPLEDPVDEILRQSKNIGSVVVSDKNELESEDPDIDNLYSPGPVRRRENNRIQNVSDTSTFLTNVKSDELENRYTPKKDLIIYEVKEE